MFITPAYAQAAGASPFGQMEGLIPLFIMLPIFYFLLIRPQQQKLKQHRAIVMGAERGDSVITGGGIVGKVTKAKEGEHVIEVEIAPNVRVEVVRATLQSVQKRGEAAKS